MMRSTHRRRLGLPLALAAFAFPVAPVQPATAALATSWQKVLAGADFTCGLTTAGGVKCWGKGTWGQLGNGSVEEVAAPVTVRGLSGGVVDLVVGDAHACAVRSDAAVVCWGKNEWGQLGDGTRVNRTTPVTIAALRGFRQISLGSRASCALTAAGGVSCWGWNYFGQIGDGTTVSHRATPTPVVGLGSGVTAVVAGHLRACAVTTAATLTCWGNNGAGQLGLGTVTDPVRTPRAAVVAGRGIASAVLSGYHTCVVTTAGTEKCWGFAPRPARERVGRGPTHGHARHRLVRCHDCQQRAGSLLRPGLASMVLGQRIDRATRHRQHRGQPRSGARGRPGHRSGPDEHRRTAHVRRHARRRRQVLGPGTIRPARQRPVVEQRCAGHGARLSKLTAGAQPFARFHPLGWWRRVTRRRSRERGGRA